MMAAWRIQTLADGSGVIEHQGKPRFRALWTAGIEELHTLTDACWTDEGHGADDALTLHAFRWIDATPGQAEFEALMREAVTEIDAWIAARL